MGWYPIECIHGYDRCPICDKHWDNMELQMHTEFNIKIEFNVSSNEVMRTFVQMCRNAMQELSTSASMMDLNGSAPTIKFTVENNEIGIKTLKVFKKTA
jgi:hypothetical protein